MSITRTEFEGYIKQFKFRELFNELGWDYVVKKESLADNDHIYELEAVAQKRDLPIFVCTPQRNGEIPDSVTRMKIDREITKRYFEHLIIFIDSYKKTQMWQLSMKEPNKPIVTRETTYYVHQTPELLYQRLRGLLFTLDEEDKIGLVDVRQRVSESFNTNTERVTRQFYDRFKNEHRAYLGFIKGIDNVVDREWYASLMLNRLMFIYFIQKKGFLDNDKDYLRNKLKSIKERKGKNKFYSFYRDFLLVLFHKGLGSPERDEQLLREIGKVPYLNGGLFDIHHIEKQYEEIQIDDDAFERVFDFFDHYEWHLDTRITATGRDINPDVIGYIFEKYINDRAAMGAYYTKEDITHYIGKNCIIPYLFQESKKECANAFREDSSLWKMLRDNPDRYIYDAVRHGVELGLPEDWKALTINEKIAAGVPEEIAIGIDTEKPDLLERRKKWNRPAAPEFALPTEIWRETIERRKRYWDIREKIERGEIQDINDFITYNLDIQQFAQDAVEQYEGSDFINAIYKAITNITVLDPTCGSGAFLFTALNILEPLYDSCIDRMENFVREDDAKDGKRFSQFRKVLDEIDRHPNRQYYIYKSIILNNLYGVDIMKEGVEIAKLRLFLKLVAEVDDIDYVEPLPDLDFNIRAGNTLVGFATYKEVQDAITSELDFEGLAEKFREEAEKVGMAFTRFKDVQLVEDQGTDTFREAKYELQKRLDELNDKLNIYLAKQYGIDPEKKPADYKQWELSHQPFHWFAEFYEIMQENGGFDVIIGNPPYVEYRHVNNTYTINGFNTETCGNLYAFVMERSIKLQAADGRLGMIVPISLVCSERMSQIRKLASDSYSIMWMSNFAIRPSPLFNGIMQRNTIIIACLETLRRESIFSTNYLRWTVKERAFLFNILNFIEIYELFKGDDNILKISTPNELLILKSIKEKSTLRIMNSVNNPVDILYYHDSGESYWTKTLWEKPIAYRNNRIVEPSQWFRIEISKKDKPFVYLLFNSNFFYWLWTVHTDCRHLTKGFIESLLLPSNRPVDNNLVAKLQKAYEDNTILFEKRPGYRSPEIKVQNFKSLIDEIDCFLASHYGFTENELDFIINYDIKYRMGEDAEGEEGK